MKSPRCSPTQGTREGHPPPRLPAEPSPLSRSYRDSSSASFALSVETSLQNFFLSFDVPPSLFAAAARTLTQSLTIYMAFSRLRPFDRTSRPLRAVAMFRSSSTRMSTWSGATAFSARSVFSLDWRAGILFSASNLSPSRAPGAPAEALNSRRGLSIPASAGRGSRFYP